MDMQLIVGALQGLAITHHSHRGSVDLVADVIMRALNTEFDQYELDKLRALLRGPQLRAALQSRDILCWVEADGLLRLVNAEPISTRAARLHLQHKVSANTCAFCWLTESPKLNALVQERGSDGGYVAGVFLHPACVPYYRRLRLQLASAGETNHE